MFHVRAFAAVLVLGLTAGAPVALSQNSKDLSVERPSEAAPLAVSLIASTENGVKIGETIDLQLTSAAKGFAHLYVLSASGRVQLWFENVPIAPDRPLAYPFDDTVVRASAPAGQEQLIFMVTRQPLAGFGRGMVRTPRMLRFSHDEFRLALGAKEQKLAAGSFGLVEQSVKVED